MPKLKEIVKDSLRRKLKVAMKSGNAQDAQQLRQRLMIMGFRELSKKQIKALQEFHKAKCTSKSCSHHHPHDDSESSASDSPNISHSSREDTTNAG